MLNIIMNEFEYISFFEEQKKELINKIKNYQERDIVEEIKKEIETSIEKNRIFIYYGLRGIGKSTALYQTLSKYPDSMFIDGTTIKDPNIDVLKLVKEYSKIKNNKILLIDEITEIPDWGKHLKTFQDILGLKIIATGSSAIKISTQKTSILRRTKFKEIQPLSFKEFLKIKYDIDINLKKEITDLIFSEPKDAFQKAKPILLKIKEKDNNIYNHFQEFLKTGFPQAFKNITIEECSDQIIDQILANDFPEITGFNLTTIKKAKLIVSAISLYKPGNFSYETIANNYSLSKNTVIDVVNSFIVSSLFIETYSSAGYANKFRKTNKLIFSSPSIRHGLMKKYPSVSQNVGFLREDSFVSAMYYNNIDITYLNEKKNADYVITKDNKTSIIEIGGTYKNTKQVKKGFLLKDDDVIDIKEDVCILPLYLLNLI
jgi:predicted AAA+ superfamily ATPase